MNSTWRITALACFALCLGGNSTAQTKPSGSGASSEDSAQSSKSRSVLQWERLSSGLEVVKLWKNAEFGVSNPQIAILRLSDEEYKQFESNTKEYLEKYQIFEGKKLNRIISKVDLTGKVPYSQRSKAQPKTGDDPWVVVIDHDLWCDTATIAVSP